MAGGLIAVGCPTFAGPASADPILDALATTTCSYTQVTDAMNAETPALAAQLRLRPDMQANLREFLAMPVEQRRQQITQVQAANSQLQEILAAAIGPQVAQVANSCAAY